MRATDICLLVSFLGFPFVWWWFKSWYTKKRILERVVADMKAGKTAPKIKSPYRVALLEDGFQVTRLTDDAKGNDFRLRWADVKEVFAHKDDVFAYDIICIGFRIDEKGNFYDVDEEMWGYEELREFLPKQFPGIREDWFRDVAFPPFEPCVTHLWGTPYTWGKPGKK